MCATLNAAGKAASVPIADETGKEYAYYAFISYKSADEKWAKWLQNKIERYRLPSKLAKEKDIVPKVYPVFRYVTDLTPGALREGLAREVASSKYLIVICSRNMQNDPTYINLEIEGFLKGGGTPERILPFIVDGEVHAKDPSQECYPPALLALGEDIPQGVNLATNSKRDAYLKLIAAMLEIKFSELKDRETERRRKRTAAVVAFAVLLAAVLAVVGANHWNYYVPQTHYYADYVERYGVAEGIYELSESDLEGRYSYYAITSSEGLVRELRCENKQGNLRPSGKNYSVVNMASSSIIKYEYYSSNDSTGLDYVDASGKSVTRKASLDSATYYDQDETQTAILKYSKDQKNASLSSDGLSGSAMSLGSDLRFQTAGAEDDTSTKGIVTKLVIDYDNGLAAGVHFAYGDYFSPVCDSNGIYGYAYEFDGLGRIAKANYLAYSTKGKDYSSTTDLSGVAGFSLSYDGPNEAAIAYFDKSGAAIISELGFASARAECDERGNRIYERYFGEDGEPVLMYEGYATLQMEYDEQGNRVVSSCYGVDGKPVSMGDGYASSRSEYDERGNCIGMSYFDTEGKPVICFEGYASYQAELDSDGRVVTAYFFGVDGNLVLTDEKYSSYKMTYDGDGNLSSTSYYGLNGELVLCRGGFASWCSEFDERGNETVASVFGTDGKPILGIDNWASYAAEYDEYGNCTLKMFFGVDNNPIETASGYAAFKLDYDNRGNLTSQKFYDPEGKLTLGKCGYAAAMKKYDGQGNCTLIEYHGTDGNLVISNFGYAAMSISYDERGNKTAVKFYDADYQPIFVERFGYASVKLEYNDKGKVVSVKRFDADESII